MFLYLGVPHSKRYATGRWGKRDALKYKKAMLSRGGPRDTAVNFDTQAALLRSH